MCLGLLSLRPQYVLLVLGIPVPSRSQGQCRPANRVVIPQPRGPDTPTPPIAVELLERSSLKRWWLSLPSLRSPETLTELQEPSSHARAINTVL